MAKRRDNTVQEGALTVRFWWEGGQGGADYLNWFQTLWPPRGAISIERRIMQNVQIRKESKQQNM